MRPRYVATAVVIGSTLACGGPRIDVAAVLPDDCGAAVVVPLVDLASLSGAIAPPVWATHLQVAPNDVFLDGASVSLRELPGIFEEISEGAKDVEGDATRFRGDLLLLVDPEVAMSRLVPILEIVQGSGFPQVHFVAQSDTAGPKVTFLHPAYAAALSARIDGLEPFGRSTAIGEELWELIARCPWVQEAFATASMAPPEARCPTLVHSVDEALPYCPLTDGKKVVTAMQLMWAPPTYPLTTVSMEMDPDATPFVVATDDRWGGVIPKLRAAGSDAGWVALEGPDVEEPDLR